MKFVSTTTTAIAVVALFLAVLSPPTVKADEMVPFPQGYAQEFTNYLSLDRTQNEDQIITLFANKQTLEAAKAGQPFPEGSIIVGEVYKAKLDKDGKPILSALGRRISDKLALIAVMQKRGDDFGKDLPEDLQNNGWDFAAFKPDGSDAGKDLNTCRTCHAPLKDSQHLFSIEHMR